MRFRKPLAILAVGATLAVAVVGGTAFAQSAPTPTPTANQQTRANYQQTRASYQNFFLDRVASLLGVDRSKLDGALTQARNDTADQAAKDGKITQDQARQSESLTGVGDFGLGGSRLGNRGDGKLFGGSGVMIAVAKALGMTTQDLRTQLQSGKTLAQLATGKEQAVKDAIVAAEKAQSDQAVQSGKMTQEQENQRLD